MKNSFFKKIAPVFFLFLFVLTIIATYGAYDLIGSDLLKFTKIKIGFAVAVITIIPWVIYYYYKIWKDKVNKL